MAAPQTPYKVIIPSDFVFDGGETPDFLAGKLLLEVQNYLAGKVEFEMQLASRSREWRLLAQRDDICLYNKTKTSERQILAYYSQLPLVIYPPNRLIVRKRSGDFDERMELATAVDKYGLVIGVVSGRSYGSGLDKEIMRLGDKLFINGGEFNAERLHKILQQNRLDGVIEYSRVFTSRLKSQQEVDQYHFIQLDDAADFSYGYIACSRSEVGKQVIQLINEALASNTMKEHSLVQHQLTFPVDEYEYIKKELELIWRVKDFGVYK